MCNLQVIANQNPSHSTYVNSTPAQCLPKRPIGWDLNYRYSPYAITFSAELAPPSGHHYPQHLYSGVGGYQPTFTLHQLLQGMTHFDHSLLVQLSCFKPTGHLFWFTFTS